MSSRMVSAVVNILLKSSGMAGRLLSLMEAPRPEASRQSEGELSRLVRKPSEGIERFNFHLILKLKCFFMLKHIFLYFESLP